MPLLNSVSVHLFLTSTQMQWYQIPGCSMLLLTDLTVNILIGVGVGYAMLVVCFLISVYYNVIIAWILFYLFDSFRADVPWRNCNHEWDSPKCAQKLSIIGNGTKVIVNSIGKSMTACQHSYLTPLEANGSIIKCILNGTGRISASEEYWK